MTLVESNRKSYKPKKWPHVQQCLICDRTYLFGNDEPRRLYCSNQYCLEVYINAFVLNRYPEYSPWDCKNRIVFNALREICTALDNDLPNTPKVFRPFTNLYACYQCGCRFFGRGEEDDDKCWYCTWVNSNGHPRKCQLFMQVNNDDLARSFRWDTADRIKKSTFFPGEEALKKNYQRDKTIYDYFRTGTLPWPVGKYHPKWRYIASEIRKRDGVCANCKVIPMNKAHHVHHIDGNKYNNTWGNLAALCKNCHGRAHAHWVEIDDLTASLNAEAAAINNACLNHIRRVHANNLEYISMDVYNA